MSVKVFGKGLVWMMRKEKKEGQRRLVVSTWKKMARLHPREKTARLVAKALECSESGVYRIMRGEV